MEKLNIFLFFVFGLLSCVKIEMNKSTACSSKKLHFIINSPSGQITRIRAGCLVLLDGSGNCLMVKEKNIFGKTQYIPGKKSYVIDSKFDSRKTRSEKIKSDRPVLGFPGGICEEQDDDIIETVIRELYEECILEDNIPTEWMKKWKTIYVMIKSSPRNMEEIILNYIYSYIVKHSISYIYGTDELKVNYYQVHLTNLYKDYLISKFNLVSINIDMLNVILELKHQHQDTNYCLSFKISSGMELYTIRLREFMVLSKKFMNYLKYKMSYSGSSAGNPFDVIREESVCLEFNNICKRIYLDRSIVDESGFVDESIPPELEQTSLLLFNRTNIQNVYDFWYETDSMQIGLNVLAIINNLMFNTYLDPKLFMIRNIIVDARSLIYLTNNIKTPGYAAWIQKNIDKYLLTQSGRNMVNQCLEDFRKLSVATLVD